MPSKIFLKKTSKTGAHIAQRKVGNTDEPNHHHSSCQNNGWHWLWCWPSLPGSRLRHEREVRGWVVLYTYLLLFSGELHAGKNGVSPPQFQAQTLVMKPVQVRGREGLGVTGHSWRERCCLPLSPKNNHRPWRSRKIVFLVFPLWLWSLCFTHN